jgi:hypothetical protein
VAIYTAYQTRILRELEDSSGTLFSTTSVLQWTNDVAREISARCDVSDDEQYVTSVTGQQSYTLPTGTVDVYTCSYDGAALTKMDTGAFFELAVAATGKSTPHYFTLFDGALYLQPIPPTTGKEIRLFRSYSPTDTASVSATTAMPFSSKYDSVMANYVKARAFEQIGDFDAAGHYSQFYEQGIDNINLERGRYSGARTPRDVY